MPAKLEQVPNGYTARFERHLKHSVGDVWAYLTDNDLLPRWFPELRVDELREGGVIKFDMQDGTFETLEIIELKPQAVLEYTWDADIVRFELEPEPDGCCLRLIEKIVRITAHTPKDLAGWHVCLDVIGALLDGSTIESREQKWKIWHEQYVQLVDSVSG